MKTYHYVTFKYNNRTMYAIKNRKPVGLFQPEPRCLMSHAEAKHLLKFLKLESTFDGLEIQEVTV